MTWGPCSAAAAAIDRADLSGELCGSVFVPLDYAHPAGRNLHLAMAEVPATGRAQGDLFVGMGGPGYSGLAYLPSYAQYYFPAAIRARFNLISFDQRGVGVSAGLHCLSTAQFDAYYQPLPPTKASEWPAAIALDKELAQGCRRAAGWELPFLGTVNAARDLDIMRAAAGEAALTYMGWSYGTRLGAAYAHLFPTHLRAAVLDGAVPPDETPIEGARAQAVGFDQELDAYLRSCVNNTCPFTGSVASARNQLAHLIADIAAHPLPTPDGRRLHGGEALNGLTEGLTFTVTWDALSTALSEASTGLGGELLGLSDQYVGRIDSGYDSVASAVTAITCADFPEQVSAAQAAALSTTWAVDAPFFAPLMALSATSCDGWQRSASQLPRQADARGGPPIVVIGNTGDPATPYAGAQRLAAELGTGHLLTYVGNGHTVYASRHVACIDDAVDAYLLDLTLPQAGLRCR